MTRNMVAAVSAFLLFICASRDSSASSVIVPQFHETPVIDGDLSEQIWTQGAVLNGFYQTHPGDNDQPSNLTEVFLGQDAASLYIGIRAQGAPSGVRASVTRRDNVLTDDHIKIYLDTFHDLKRAYLFIFNPLGIQQDGLWTEGHDPDYSLDVLMDSKGRVTEHGYTIEVKIPFHSLRYESGKGKVWGLHLIRKLKNTVDEENSWMPLVRGQAGFLAQAGTISGFDAVPSTRVLELIPVLNVSESGRRFTESGSRSSSSETDPGRFVNRPVETDPGMTAKLVLASDSSLEAAVNPDFAQIESDQLVITANQRFPIFFEEKRSFFLEGIDLFQLPLRTLHTRTIIDPEVAVKFSGKRGRTAFGALFASDLAPGNFSDEELLDPYFRDAVEPFIGRNANTGIFRLKREIAAESYIGLLATTYNFVEKHNHTAGFDGRWALNSNNVLSFQSVVTTSRSRFYDPNQDRENLRIGNGFGYHLQAQRTGRHFNLTLQGEGRTPDFRSETGFTTQTNINIWSALLQYNSEPRPDANLISWSFLTTVLSNFDWQGRMKYGYIYPRILLNFKHQTYLNLYAYADYLKILEEEFGPRRSAIQPGAFWGEPERSTIYKGFTIETGTTPNQTFSTTFTLDRSWKSYDYDFGAGPQFPRVSPAALADPAAPLDPGPGTSLDLSASINWRLQQSLLFTIRYTKSRLKRDDTQRLAYDQDLYSFRAEKQFTRFAFVRARMDYDSLRSNVSNQVLIGWTPNPGTAFYAGYTDDLNHNGYNPFTGHFEPGLHRNSRTFFVKMSYLFQYEF